MTLSVRSSVFRVFNFHLPPSLWRSPCNEWRSILGELQQTAFPPFPPEKRAHLGGQAGKLVISNLRFFSFSFHSPAELSWGPTGPRHVTSSSPGPRASTPGQSQGSKGMLLHRWQTWDCFTLRHRSPSSPQNWSLQLKLQRTQRHHKHTPWLFIYLN